jgi:hypothetical protein
MSTTLPEKGTAEYYEAVADEPSDFIDDGPEEGTAAARRLQMARLVRRLQRRRRKTFRMRLLRKPLSMLRRRRLTTSRLV